MKYVEGQILCRTPYTYDMHKASRGSGLECNDQSYTQQHMKDECDINVLMKGFVVHGNLPQLTMPPLQGDFTNAPTYQEALNLMVKAQQSFQNLDARIRTRFDNDPARFVDFCSDEANRDELRAMGLWSPEAIAAHQKASAASDEARIAKAVEERLKQAVSASRTSTLT